MLKNFTRRQLIKDLGASMFDEGTIIKVSKYYIHIKYGDFKKASFNTTVSTEKSMCDLPMSKHPQYIRDFIEDYNISEELKITQFKIGQKVQHSFININNVEEIEKDRVDIITNITLNMFGDLQYHTEEISDNDLNRKRIGKVYGRWLVNYVE